MRSDFLSSSYCQTHRSSDPTIDRSFPCASLPPLWPTPPDLRNVKDKLLRFVPLRLRNRYGAGVLCFIAWIAFFDDHDMYTTYKLRRELSTLKEDHAYYAAEIQVTRERIHQLTSDAALLEKFARERYMFKRDNEDIFVLVAEEPKK